MFTSGSGGLMAWTASAHIWIASTTVSWLLRTVFRISPWSSWVAVLVSLMIPPRCLLQTKVRTFALLVKRALDISSTAWPQRAQSWTRMQGLDHRRGCEGSAPRARIRGSAMDVAAWRVGGGYGGQPWM